MNKILAAASLAGQVVCLRLQDTQTQNFNLGAQLFVPITVELGNAIFNEHMA